MKHVEVARYEMKPYIYGGDNMDKHIPQWWGYAAGDKQDDTGPERITFNPKNYPPGTKITVEVPVCPRCGEVYKNCMVRGYGEDECDFNWKQWAEEQYS